MVKSEWNALLFEIFMQCYKLPEWESLVALHDDEDREYFRMLEALTIQ